MRDTNTSVVSPVSPMVFRQFLPHERRAARTARRQDEHEDIREDTLPQATTKLPGGLLSSEDISVLFEAAEHINENREEPHGQTDEQADELYLPFTFAARR